MNSSMVTPDLHRWLNNGVTSDCSIGLNEFEEVVAPSKFIIPPVAQPSVYCEKNFSAEYGADMNQDIKFSKGTTTLSFMFEHGVIVAVDSRATQGAYIASNSVMKVIDITPKILGTMAGGAADCQFWERHLGRQCRLFELRNQEEMTVRGASKLLAAIMANYRGYGLSMGTMICGYNGIYYVDNDGMRLAASRQNPYFSVGSGSTYAYGVLDQHYAHDLSVDAAVDLGKRAIYHAGHRDAMSGGVINVYYIGPHGHEKRWTSDLMVIHDSIN